MHSDFRNTKGSSRRRVRKAKVFGYTELAEYYEVTPQTVSKRLGHIDLRTLDGVIEAIRLLDRRYG